MHNSEETIQQIHDNVFEFLMEKHFEEKKQGRDFFFRPRNSFKKAGDKFLFIHNNECITITFWYGNEFANASVLIYIHLTGLIDIVVICTDSNTQKIFSILPSLIPDLNNYGDSIWRKEYTSDHSGNYLEYLKTFLENDKLIIDQFLDRIDSGNNSLDFSEITIRKLTQAEFYNTISVILQRKYETIDYYFEENERQSTGMPFALKGLEVRNYKGIDHLLIEHIPIDTKWIVLTGENGYGKTSLLQAIAIGFYGVADSTNKFMDNNSYIRLEGKGYVEHISNFHKTSLLAEGLIEEEGADYNTHFTNLSISFFGGNEKFFNSQKDNLAVYGASRLSSGNDTNQPDISNTIYNLFYSNSRLVDVENELKESNAYNKPKFELLKQAFIKLIPDLIDIEVVPIDGKPIVKYLESEAIETVVFNELASGFKNIIVMVGDIITRLSRKQSNLSHLKELKGIVIIDELELHLHPKYQKNFPKILTELLPNVLFIASTHSPIPLLGMPKQTVLLKVNRDKDKGITAERLDVDFTNLLPNAILSSPIFGFEDFVPDAHNSKKIINVEDSYLEVTNNKNIQDKIGSFLSDEKTQELLKLIKNTEGNEKSK